MPRHYLLDGACHSVVDGSPLPEGAVEVPRPPAAFERLVDGEWVKDCRAEADAVAGADHIAEARALKYLEAQMIKAGLPVANSLLAPEAAAKNMTLSDLADEVIARRTAFREAEVRRQQMQDGQEPDFEL